ncbi:ribose transport system ATP-binding protein [Nocardioides alpinus]|jgi:ribose transport system ATP-binding protein|uniref:Sugar ABC transporter ATP-binding protein n=2 Tax=Nocardioides TaxID=1839 RepID=A0A4Q2SJR3_9ACTN|nr:MULTISPECIES: sugar ABC transporter ATP-binding protein [Nocardioides]PKH38502.1 sugar ABC transporter ATP-binding protein [Nocardioides alpinus]RYC05353.1 sugar ABC transporter ATP-binding protein [Nocardioides zhouii]SFB47678.1 ribose transport system ATP-binding protein [Nocardioides alpinus]
MNEHMRSESASAEPGSRVALAAEDISKTYGATRALDEVSLEVSSGAIHGLMGGNGSGKSTFIKMLAGVVTPDQGRLALQGEWIEARSHTPARAKASGLHFVHQQNSTFPDLTVAENLALGRGFESTTLKSIDWKAQKARSRRVLDRFEIDVAADTHMVRLSPAAQMMVAIARALQDQDETDERGVLVLDEPTASLPKHEVDVLLTALRRYAADGQTIIYVSHRLEEVTAIADEVTVLRNGRVASRLVGAEISHDSLVAGITGSVAAKQAGTVPRGSGVVDSRVHLSHVAGFRETALTLRRPSLTEVDDETLLLRAGEIVGVAGLLGSGRSRLLKQIFGAVPRDDLEVTLNSGPVPPSDVRAAMKKGIAFVPENRLREAALPELSIAENLSVTCLSDHSRAGWIKPSRERKAAQRLIKEFGVRAPSASAPLTALSGGNQQKVILARWLQRRPTVLLLDEPTQGVDIGARNEIHELVRAAAAAGTAVLVVSSDFGELASLAHRAVVMSGSEIVDSIDGPLTEDILNDVVYAQEKSL